MSYGFLPMSGKGSASNVASMGEARSGAALYRTEPDGRIREWNAEAERLTGIPAADAVGRSCWEVIAGQDADGGVVCHPGCSLVRLAAQGWPVRCVDLHARTPRGRKRLTISTIVVRSGDQDVVLHPMRETAAAGSEAAAGDDHGLTPRQREILRLLVEGVRAKQIAARLTLSETTVRNHIRAILLELGAHSQLEAVARARTLSLVADESAA